MKTPLHYAAKHHSGKCVDILLSTPGVDIDAQDDHQQTPLHVAASHGSQKSGKVT